MNSVISTVSRVLPGGDPKEVPHWTQPMLIDIAKCRPLGPVGRRTWYDWPEMRLEVEEVGEPISPDSPAIAEGPAFKLWQDGGGYLVQPLRAWPRGEYLKRTSVAARGPKPPAAQRPVDLLNSIATLTGNGGAGRYSFRGCEAILARYRSKGVDFKVVGEGTDVLVTAAGGRLLNSHRDELALLTPLLVPYLINGAVYCEVTKHREPVEAVTLAAAIPTPIPWDGVCS